jgi:hypothetical protein
VQGSGDRRQARGDEVVVGGIFVGYFTATESA